MPDDHAAFEAVYVQHLAAVSSYLARRVARDDIDDLAADVFAIAWRKRGDVAPGEELPWLYRIASYQVANHRRRLATRASMLGFLSAPDSAPAADSAFEGDPHLAEAWTTLSATQREVLALVVLDDLPVNEAAIALGISANAASIRLHRAKKTLAEVLVATRPPAERPNESDTDERSATSAT